MGLNYSLVFFTVVPAKAGIHRTLSFTASLLGFLLSQERPELFLTVNWLDLQSVYRA